MSQYKRPYETPVKKNSYKVKGIQPERSTLAIITVIELCRSLNVKADPVQEAMYKRCLSI